MTTAGDYASNMAELFGTTVRTVQRFRTKAGVVGQHPMSPQRAAS
jgi:hypothetical protein